MNTLSTDELKGLVNVRTGPAISIVMPTERLGAETRQNPIRFRKLLREAEERLVNTGLHIHETQQLLEPARRLLEDTLFWQHQSAGLAVYGCATLFRHYSLSTRPEELVLVGDRFHIKPLLHMLTGDQRFHILALSQNQVRFFTATQYAVHEVPLKSVPASVADTVPNESVDRQVQFRTLTGGRPGKGDAMFYGQGSASDLSKERIVRYFHQVDDGLRKELRDQRPPLVFAGVDYLFPMYKEVNSYPLLMEEPIAGSPDELGPEVLHKRAWQIVQPFFERQRQIATEYYRQIAGSARASNRVNEIAPAAYHGRVETLFVQMGVQQWGAFASEVGAVHEYDAPQPGSEDMLDFAALHTLLHGGTVYAVEQQYMPNGSSAAAVFRY